MKVPSGGAAWSSCVLWILLWSAAVPAHAAGVEVSGVWARATLPGQKVAGVYMEIRSERDARLVGVASPAAASAEVHEMRHQDGVMRMRRVEALDLPAGEAVQLAPGGYHVMLFDLREPLEAGRQVALTLEIEIAGRREAVPVTAVVKARDAR
jgi:hypothetical protein